MFGDSTTAGDVRKLLDALAIVGEGGPASQAKLDSVGLPFPLDIPADTLYADAARYPAAYVEVIGEQLAFPPQDSLQSYPRYERVLDQERFVLLHHAGTEPARALLRQLFVRFLADSDALYAECRAAGHTDAGPRPWEGDPCVRAALFVAVRAGTVLSSLHGRDDASVAGTALDWLERQNGLLREVVVAPQTDLNGLLVHLWWSITEYAQEVGDEPSRARAVTLAAEVQRAYSDRDAQ